MNKKIVLLAVYFLIIGVAHADCDLPDDVPCPYENSAHKNHHRHCKDCIEKEGRHYSHEPLRHNRSGYTYENAVGLEEDDENFRKSYKPIRQNFEDYNDSEWDYNYYSYYKYPYYVDYFPYYYRTYPYYFGYRQGPYLGNSYGF